MEHSKISTAFAPYERTSSSQADRTCLYREVLLVPSAVVECFCVGDEGDGFKVSGQWTFRKGDLIFTLYDWKSTDLYERGMWTPQELWASREAFPLHIGSKDPATAEDADDFAQYLLKLTIEAEL
jgi:hypothetical protein